METGQRGYLLTGDPSSLAPYTDGKNRIGTAFASLRAGLANRTEQERSIESKLESLAASKQAEMERTISLRQQGYRRRAFNLVDRMKVGTTWMGLASWRLPCPQRKAAPSRDSTMREPTSAVMHGAAMADRRASSKVPFVGAPDTKRIPHRKVLRFRRWRKS